MLDIKFVRANPDVVRENIKKKFQDDKLPMVDEVLELDQRNRDKLSIISVWYGISYSGTIGSPNFSISTFSLSSFPIGTDGSIMFGIVIIIFLIFSSTSFSSVESASPYWNK